MFAAFQHDELAPRGQRGAFTLVEVMLVLAIIAIIGAIAVPRVDELVERQKLRGMANELRLEWDSARLEAMRTGQAQVFTCLVGSGSYSIRPLILQADTANAGQGATVMLSGGNLAETQTNGMLTAADTSQGDTQELESPIVFASCNVAGDMQAYTLAQDAQTMGAGDFNTQTVGQSVIFYPDGSSSTAEVRIQNDRGDVRGIQIRGLTGHTKVVDVLNIPSTPGETKK